jgi:hypothetical protein
MAKTYIVRLSENYDVEKIIKIKTGCLKAWRDPTETEIQTYGDVATCDLIKYYDWNNQVNAFISMCPLEYKDGTQWKRFFSLQTENASGIEYFVSLLLNYGIGSPLDRSKDSINLDPEADFLLHMVIGTTLEGNKHGNWEINKQLKGRNSKLAAAIQNVKDVYLGSEQSIRDMNKERLKAIKLEKDMPLSVFREKFTNQLNHCKNLGIMENFEQVKDIWMESVKFKRENLDIVRLPLLVHEVRQAIAKEDATEFILKYCESLTTMTHSPGGIVPVSLEQNLSSHFSGNDGVTNFRGVGTNTSGGRGRGRGSFGRGSGGGFNESQSVSSVRGMGGANVLCNACGKGHAPGKCPFKDRNCYNCGGRGHPHFRCPSERMRGDTADSEREPAENDGLETNSHYTQATRADAEVLGMASFVG